MFIIWFNVTNKMFFHREYSQALLRLTNQIRGIADPLVAIYARAYLCRVCWVCVYCHNCI